MNRVQPENVHSTIFTPQEYQVELIDSCLQENTVAVLASRSTRTFLVTMITRELSYQTRSIEQGGLAQRTLIIGKSGPKLVKAGEAIQQNTNLAVATYTSLEQVKGWSEKWESVFLDSQVIVMTANVLEIGFQTDLLQFDLLNLFVIIDAHQILASDTLNGILSRLSPACRILALTSPVLNRTLSPSSLDSLLSYLKKTTSCNINTSSEIVTILRYVNKPHIRVITCSSPFSVPRPDLETEIRRLTAEAMQFLEEHRYDLVEVYGPDYAEFCVGVPDPIREPKQILKDFLHVLDNLGLWCADRAALYSLVEIEKLKKKTAYDRHYLLLCLVFSVMARVRAVIESAFEHHSELNQILNFSTPKVLRLIDILRQIRPLNFVDPRKRREKAEQEAAAESQRRKLSSESKALSNKCCLCDCATNIVELGTTDNIVQNSKESKGVKKPDSGKKFSSWNDASVTANSPVKGCETNVELEGSRSGARPATPVQTRLHGDEGVESDAEKEAAQNGCAHSCSSLSDAEEETVKAKIAKSHPDTFPTSIQNGNLSRSASEDSFHESKLSLPSVPNLSLLNSRTHSQPLVCDNNDVESSMNVSSSSSCEMISCNSSISKGDDNSLPDDTPLCHCQCHNTSSSPSQSPDSLTNGCISPSDVREEVFQDCAALVQDNEGTLEIDHPGQTNLKVDTDSDIDEEDRQYDSAPDKCSKNDTILDRQCDSPVTTETDSSDSFVDECLKTSSKEFDSQRESPVDKCLKTNNEVDRQCDLPVERRCESKAKVEQSDSVLEIEDEVHLQHESTDNQCSKESSSPVRKCSEVKEKKIRECDASDRDSLDERPLVPESLMNSVPASDLGEAKLSEDSDTESQQNAATDAVEATEAHQPRPDPPPPRASTRPHKQTVKSEAVAMADTLAQLLPNVSRPRRRRDEVKEKVKVHNPDDPDSVCGLLFVQDRNIARIVYRLLKELSDIGGEFGWIFPQYTVELCKNASDDPRAAEAEHKKQEEVFRRFRHHECNLLVSTAVLEEGIEIPNCNLVLRFDPATSYSSYVYSRGRAKGLESFYFHLVVKDEEESFFNDMASYAAYEQVLLRECGSVDLGTDSEVSTQEADAFLPPYVTPTGASVSMSTAITLLNKYCAKLPSDTFTRLTAMWSIESRDASSGEEEFQCTISLPINSPLKGFTKGSWLAKRSMSKMSAALTSCARLHQIGELNDALLPVGKESMQLDAHLCPPLPDDQVMEGMPRSGSTKRRQYYYKKVAECLVGREPSPSLDLWVYKLDMVLSCPIPDDQNTRGRKIYRPELSSRSLALVTTKPIPQVSGFPVFTRSGEVMVRMKETHERISIPEEKLEDLKVFHMFTFTHVLRLEKYPIKFRPANAKSTFFIAPLLQENGKEEIDWEFVKVIRKKGDHKPTPPSEEMRNQFQFDQSLYQDAVVMPWYRNQDQPQFFYVAEICSHLHPQSDFPDAGFESFEKYYLTKYGLQICNLGQPLLDVDHTSARLNLLTPRHVNRKGVALPTTSEETKKAKRENLQQKQILVPELCTIHPFPASLWRKAVCLPTILYRINGLLLANELRVHVALQIGLGMTLPRFNFDWPNLDFGWTLADVLAKSVEASKESKEMANKKTKKEEEGKGRVPKPPKEICGKEGDGGKGGSEMEIGTWSNDMALSSPADAFRDTEDEFEIETFDPNVALPDNLTILDGSCLGLSDDVEGELGADWGTGLTERKASKAVVPRAGKDRGDGVVRVGSPSNFETDGWDAFNPAPGFGHYGATPNYDDYYDCGDDFDGYDSDQEEEYEEEAKEREEREWEEQGKRRGVEDKERLDEEEEDTNDWPQESVLSSEEKEQEFEELIRRNKEQLMRSKCYLAEDEPIVIEKACRQKKVEDEKALLEVSDLLNSSLESKEGPLEEEGPNECQVVRATPQADLVSFGVSDGVSDALCEVDRPKTLKEVKIASEGLPRVLPQESENASFFSFDSQPDLETHPGPAPSIILQALTMSNANDGVNLERLETIGDSYLKYAITNYLYCTYTQKHEGKLSYLRSKQVSNLNLYRLGKRKGLGECMVATKFEPHDNWLPPGYFVPRELEEALIDSGVPAGHWNMADFPGLHDLGSGEIRRLVQERSEQIKQNKVEQLANELISVSNPQDLPIFIPYNLLTQHSIPDKSISDCVEALIGAYLTTCGPRGALLFMSWLGIKVLPSSVDATQQNPLITYHQLLPPRSPLDSCPYPDAKEQLELLLSGYQEFEKKVGYTFRDRSYLLQAFTHASYYRNRLTDCYQRLEFLGDAVLDYLITRHLFEDKRQHSPGSLTDLRSALVNNTIFACLAVKFEFHKYFRHFSPGLDHVVRDFVRMQEENGHKINEEYYFMEEEECEAAEDIEVPKALGDVFESVAGAIFLDSGGSLDAVWRVYYFMMKNEIEQFSGVVPKSPIRELLETEPETAKFGKPERLVDGKVRVSVEIFGKGSFSGVGRNYRIAKSTAAKRALRHLKKLQVLANTDSRAYL